MGEVGRVQGPGGAEPGAGRKDRSRVDDDRFKKIMKVEEVHEIDPHEKRKRKRPEEAEDETEALKKANGITESQKVKPIEDVLGGPVSSKKGSTDIPTSPTPNSGVYTPLADFSAHEIEAFAWEEDTSVPPPPSTASSQSGNNLGGRSSQPSTPEQPAPTSAPASPPSLEKQIEPDVGVDESLGKKGIPSEPDRFVEEWPQTTSYYPSSAFSSTKEPDITGMRPPPSEETVRGDSREQEETRSNKNSQQRTTPSRAKAKEEEEKDKEENETPASSAVQKKKTTRPKKAALPPGAPGTSLKGEGKEKVPSFSELMEGEKTPPAAGSKHPPLSEEVPPEGLEELKEKAPKMAASFPAPPPGSSAPRTDTTATPEEEEVAAARLAKELPSAEVPPTLTPEEGFTTLKKTAPTTMSTQEDGGTEEERKKVRGMSAPLSISEESTGEGVGKEREGEKHKKSKEETAEELAPFVAGIPTDSITPPLPAVSTIAATAPTAYAQMDPQILALFERMVGVMTILKTTGISETVMTLNARQFTSSVLYGSQIIIREFSTAPKAFNVEFVGSPEALVQVEQNLSLLLSAVQQGNFNFAINRFDMKLQGTEKPLFSRKEASKGKGEQEQQGKEKENP